MTPWVWTALLVNLFATGYGWMSLRRGYQSHIGAFTLGIISVTLTTLALGERGELRGACPLSDPGEIFLFIAWSLSIFFVLTGGAYRVSLLGLFTSPATALFLGLVLVPGMLTESPVRATELDPWKESHAATSVLAFGALGLGALAGVMFLILDSRLKQQKAGWVSMKMPPVSTLVTSISRLLLLGVIVLTLGIIAGFLTSLESGLVHLIAAGGVWVAYLVLLGWYKWIGITPRVFARLTIALFALSCITFAVI